MNIKTSPPPIYAIWAEGRPEGPLSGQAGYLAEDGQRLFFFKETEAEQKIQDLRNGCLRNDPAATYRCINFPDSRLPDRSMAVEAIREHDLQPGFDPEGYVAKGQAYGDTGGGFMVGTMSFHLPDINKTVWVNCNDEGVTVTSADYVWDEDHSGSWSRYEDVLLLKADLQETLPEELDPWLPMVRETLRYTEQQAAAHDKRFGLPSEWQAAIAEQRLSGPEMASPC